MTKVVNIIEEPYDVYIGRPSIWGNPFIKGKDGNRREVIEKYREWVLYDKGAEELRNNLYSLKGKILGCYCKPKDCHGDVLVNIIENNLLNILVY